MEPLYPQWTIIEVLFYKRIDSSVFSQLVKRYKRIKHIKNISYVWFTQNKLSIYATIDAKHYKHTITLVKRHASVFAEYLYIGAVVPYTYYSITDMGGSLSAQYIEQINNSMAEIAVEYFANNKLNIMVSRDTLFILITVLLLNTCHRCRVSPYELVQLWKRKLESQYTDDTLNVIVDSATLEWYSLLAKLIKTGHANNQCIHILPSILQKYATKLVLQVEQYIKLLKKLSDIQTIYRLLWTFVYHRLFSAGHYDIMSEARITTLLAKILSFSNNTGFR